MSAERAGGRPVTVVVPVYGDLESLRTCVASLLEHVDLSRHRILLSNDNGPEADRIEAALLEQIGDRRNIRYSRNPQNLGFVGNCNRAVLELDDSGNDILLLNSDTIVTAGFLDELTAVLAESPTHGAVCPRSNNATIASLPFALRVPSAGREPARTMEVHAALSALLPRYSYTPTAMGFCLLIRRELIDRFGLFDEAFAPGYGEENDFCLRIGRHGFRSMIAHRALVMHQGARSFTGSRREALRSAHEKLVVERYPDYTATVRRYIYIERDPVDVFADCLVPAGNSTKLLVDIGPGPLHRASDAELVSELLGVTADTMITIAAPERHVAQTRRRFAGANVVAAERLDGVWDAGLALGRADADQRARLNRTCLRLIVTGPRSDLPHAPAAAAASDVLGLACDPNVDIAALRERWTTITAEPGYLERFGTPKESWQRRAFRRAELAFPRPVGYLKATVRRALGRRPA